MKTITANDIPAKFREILDKYKATDRWVRNRNNLNPSLPFSELIAIKRFSEFIENSFLWPNNEGRLWIAIEFQDKPEILRLTAELEGEEKAEQLTSDKMTVEDALRIACHYDDKQIMEENDDITINEAIEAVLLYYETKQKEQLPSDMDRFIKLYKSFGIEIERPELIDDCYIIDINNKLLNIRRGYSFIDFDSSGKFISQGFYE